MESSEKAQKWVTGALLSLIALSLLFTLFLGTARCAWFVGIVGLLAATGMFFFIMSLLGGELRRHVLDVTAHPGGLETINQDLEKVGNIIAEHREALNQIPDLRSRLERLEAWEADLAKGGQALAQVEKLSKDLSELGVHTSSRCEGLGASLREVHKKLADLDALRQRISDLQKVVESLPSMKEELGRLSALSEQVSRLEARASELGGLAQDVVALKESMVRLDALNNQVRRLEEHTGSLGVLAQDVAALKQGLASLTDLPEEVRKLAERFAERVSTVSAEAAAMAQELSAVKQGVASVADLPEEVRKLAEQFAEKLTRLSSDVSLLAQELKTVKVAIAAIPSLSEQAAQASSLAQDVAGLKESMAVLSPLPEEFRKWAEQSAQRASALTEELARIKAQFEPHRALPQTVELLQNEVKEIGPRLLEMGKALGQVEAVKQALTKVEAMEAKVAEQDGLKSQIAELAKSVEALRAAPAAAGPVVAPGDSSRLDGLAAELAEVKKVVAELQAEQPHLDVNIQEAKLVSQQDRTVVMCTLTVRNLSNKPNEITAVRAELDSGRDRLAPMSIRHWLPDGKQTNEERLILLPQKILERSTSGPITLTAIGWPLEKSQESYPFRITLKDKNGNEFVKNHRLVPEGSGPA